MRMYKIVLMSIVLILGFNFTVEAQSNPGLHVGVLMLNTSH